EWQRIWKEYYNDWKILSTSKNPQTGWRAIGGYSVTGWSFELTDRLQAKYQQTITVPNQAAWDLQPFRINFAEPGLSGYSQLVDAQPIKVNGEDMVEQTIAQGRFLVKPISNTSGQSAATGPWSVSGESNNANQAGIAAWGDEGNDLIEGSDGRDSLHGGADDDELAGLEGDDQLEGDAGNDVLLGGRGNDVLLGGTDNDMLRGQTGNDILDGGDGNDLLVGDIERAEWQSAEQTLEQFLSEMRTYTFDDVLKGGTGHDTLIGADGADSLDGGEGDDFVLGDFSFDATDGNQLVARNYNDTLQGGAGNDTLEGGLGSNQLSGDAGNDLLIIRELKVDAKQWGGNNLLDGGEGNDTLVGQTGHDTLLGGTGTDALLGGAGNDSLEGGDGADLLLGNGGSQTSDSDNDSLSGGQGNDEADGQAGDDLILGGQGNDSLWGGEGNDKLEGDGENDELYGGAGNDVLSGGSGDDNVQGDSGNDTLQGGVGIDMLDGGEGDDVYLVGDMTADTAGATLDAIADKGGRNTLVFGSGSATGTKLKYLGNGGDLLVTRNGQAFVLKNAASSANFNWRFGSAPAAAGSAMDGADAQAVSPALSDPDSAEFNQKQIMNRFYDGMVNQNFNQADKAVNSYGGGVADILSGSTFGDTLEGNDGDDQIDGGMGDDRLLGDAGNDTLKGSLGNDTLHGGGGNDLLQGSDGDDVYLIELADTLINSTVVVEDSQGSNRLAFGAGIKLDDVTLIPDARNLKLQVGGAVIVLAQGILGGAIDTFSFADGRSLSLSEFKQLVKVGSVRPIGTAGPDELRGDVGDDTLDGAAGNDKLYGFEGKDLLIGGQGNDLLDGGQADDTLQGGAGNDEIYAGDGTNWVEGGTGDDFISASSRSAGTTGQVIAKFGLGDGHDSLFLNPQAGPNNARIVFGTGIRPSDVTLQRNGNALLFMLPGGQDIVEVADFFAVAGVSPVERVEFTDGGTWSVSDLANQLANLLKTDGNDTIDGLTTADLIRGGLGRDYIHGGAGNDSLFGDEDDDQLFGDNDDDQLNGGTGNDILQGGLGQDTLLGGAGQDNLQGGDGNDSLSGDSDQDTLNGGAGADLLDGGDGNDLLSAEDGNDWLSGGSGADKLSGDQGNDTLLGGADNDTLQGGDGDDNLDGGAGIDILDGGDGNDQIVWGDAAEAIRGGSGNDSYVQAATGGSLRLEYTDTIGFDTLKLHTSIKPADVALARNGADLVLMVGGQPLAHLSGYFALNPQTESQVDQIQFNDGTVWQAADLASKARSLLTGDDKIDLSTSLNRDDRQVYGGLGSDTLTAESNPVVKDQPAYGHADKLFGEDGNDLLDGGSGNDSLYGGVGNDTLLGGADTIPAGNATAFQTWSGNDVLDGGEGNDVLAGQGGDDTLQGGEGSDVLWGGSQGSWDAGNDLLDGGAGDDTIYAWGTGNDTIIAGTGVDELMVSNSSGTGNPVTTLRFAQGDDAIVAGKMTQIKLNGSCVFEFGTGIQPQDLILETKAGGGFLLAYSKTDVIEIRDNAANASLSFRFADGRSLSYAELLASSAGKVPVGIVTGTSGNDRLQINNQTGGHLQGLAGQDTLTGSAAADTLDGGAGNDSLIGGAGSDTYRFNLGDNWDFITDDTSNGARNVASFGAGIAVTDLKVSLSGSDLIVQYGTGGDGIQITNGEAGAISEFRFADGTVRTLSELLAGMGKQLQGTAGADTLAGGVGDDQIYGAAGNDSLLGHGGNDILIGGIGNDSLDGGAGDDALDGNEGADRLLGGDGNDQLVGNTGNDSLDGGDGRDGLEGGDGKDTLSGGNGNDVLRGDDEGSDLGDADLLNGGEGNDDLFGGMGNDTLKGDAGDDNLLGGDGDDLLLGGDGNDALEGEAGNDTLQAGLGDGWMSGGDGNDQLLGGTGMNVMAGGMGNDLLDGGENNDGLTGDDGLDTLLGGAGNDDLSGGADADSLEGGSDNDNLNGDAGDDTLNGGQGVDSLQGGEGNDVYLFNLGDDATQQVDQGDGTLTTTWTTLWDNAGSNEIRFGAGIRVQDIKFQTNPDNGSIWLNYSATDKVELIKDPDLGASTISTYRFATGESFTHAEMLAIAQGGPIPQRSIDGTAGNDKLIGTAKGELMRGLAGNDTLEGAAGNDTLDGGTGNDSLSGGDGDDSYLVDSAGDVIVEAVNQGTDHVQASVSFTLGNNLENLTLQGTANLTATGNALANQLVGNGGNNVLDGKSGADTLKGGAGNDTYVVDNAGDSIIELAGEGNDLVQASVSYTLAAELENLTLTGTGAINATGNDLGNVLIGNAGANSLSGNAGNDTLDGGAGVDSLAGGIGNDTYIVDNASDKITESANSGTDTVLASVNWTLGSDLENLTLTGGSALNGTGNAAANLMVGNTGANSLNGAAGNDTLDGAAGNDTLTGGSGNDTYRMAIGYGVDTIIENDSVTGNQDIIEFAGGITASQVTFKKVNNHLEVQLKGTTDKLVIQNWYGGSQYRVERFKFSDGTTLSDVDAQARAAGSGEMISDAAPSVSVSETCPAQWQDESSLALQTELLISAMAGFNPQDAGQSGTLLNYQDQTMSQIAASW
ncbi:calcium-binding protein, partial [Parachitinimonas caeni]